MTETNVVRDTGETQAFTLTAKVDGTGTLQVSEVTVIGESYSFFTNMKTYLDRLLVKLLSEVDLLTRSSKRYRVEVCAIKGSEAELLLKEVMSV